MIITTNNSTFVENDGSFKTEGITFSQNKIAKMFMIVLKGYSDAISSTVREITSNCVDSHTEAKVDTPVIVDINYDDGGWYISFEDNGVGISTDRFNNIYRKLLESTKENSNDLIGGWGLGSKLPLAYREDFYLTTRFDGIEYSYLIFMNGETGCPDTTLLSEQSTDLCNGSIVKVYIESDDLYKFQKACRDQLTYFDNVIFRGQATAYTKNEYKIYDAINYKYRPDSSIKNLHLCIDRVVYPLDMAKIGDFEYKGCNIMNIDLPFALKFKTGDLKVTPTREQIEYNKDTIAKIKEKIILFFDEFFNYINTNGNTFEGTFLEYSKLLNGNRKEKIINFQGNNIIINEYSDIFPLINTVKWNKAAHLPITFDHLLAMKLVYKYYAIRDGEGRMQSEVNGIQRWSTRQLYLIDSQFKFLLLGNSIYKEEASNSDKVLLRAYNRNCDVYKIHALDFSFYKKELRNRIDVKTPLGLHKILKELKEILVSEFRIWDDIIVPEAFKLRYYQERNVTRIPGVSKPKRENHIIPVRDILKDTQYDINTLTDIDNFTGIIVYGNIKEKKELEIVGKLLSDYLKNKARSTEQIKYKKVKTYSKISPTEDTDIFEIKPYKRQNSDKYKEEKALKVIRIAEGNFKYFKMNKNAIHVKLFNNAHNDVLINVTTAKVLKDNLYCNLFTDSDNIRTVRKINSKIADKLKAIQDYCNKHYRNGYIHEIEEYLSKFILANKQVILNQEYVKLWQEVEEYFGDYLPVVQHLEPATLASLLLKDGKRIDNAFYLINNVEPIKLVETQNLIESTKTRFPTREEILNNNPYIIKQTI